MLIFYHEIMVWIVSGLLLILTIFFLSTLINFIKQKKRVTLYLTLNYLSFIVAMIFFGLAHLTTVLNGTIMEFYFHSSMFANVFAMFGIITNILFHAKFAQVKKSVQITKIVFGVLIILWILMPFNFEVGGSSGGFSLKYITYTLMSAYGIVIYAGLSTSFFKMAHQVTSQSRNQLIALGMGSVIFLLYFVIITVFGITQLFLFLIISMLCLFGSFFCYFIGIYLPKFRTKK